MAATPASQASSASLKAAAGRDLSRPRRSRAGRPGGLERPSAGRTQPGHAGRHRSGDGVFDATAMTRLRDETLSAPGWGRPPLWVRGDFHSGNLLTVDECLHVLRRRQLPSRRADHPADHRGPSRLTGNRTRSRVAGSPSAQRRTPCLEWCVHSFDEWVPQARVSPPLRHGAHAQTGCAACSARPMPQTRPTQQRREVARKRPASASGPATSRSACVSPPVHPGPGRGTPAARQVCVRSPARPRSRPTRPTAVAPTAPTCAVVASPPSSRPKTTKPPPAGRKGVLPRVCPGGSVSAVSLGHARLAYGRDRWKLPGLAMRSRRCRPFRPLVRRGGACHFRRRGGRKFPRSETIDWPGTSKWRSTVAMSSRLITSWGHP